MQVSPRCRCCWNRARPDVTFPPSVKRRWLAASPSTLLFPSLSLPALTTATTPMMGREKTPLFHCMLILSMKSSLSRVVCGQQSGKYGLGLFPCEARMRQSLSLFLSTTHSVRPVEWDPDTGACAPTFISVCGCQAALPLPLLSQHVHARARSEETSARLTLNHWRPYSNITPHNLVFPQV